MVELIFPILFFLYSLLTINLILHDSEFNDSKVGEFLRKYIFSEIPIFTFSEDKYFHEFRDGEDLRFSLFYLPLGSHKFYFFTYSKSSFKFFHLLSLDKIYEDKFNDKENRMDSIVKSNLEKYQEKEDDKKLYLEVLKDKIEESNKTNEISKIKATVYITIIAAILSAFIGKIGEVKSIFEFNFFIIFTISLTFLYFLNIVILLFEFHSVQSYPSERYADFREEKNKDEAYFKYLYKNNQWLQIYTDRDVSYVKNIEYYIKSLFIIMSILAVILIF